MTPTDLTVAAPAAHRAVASVLSPVLGLLISRALLHLFPWPELATTLVCVALGAFLGWRAWRSRVELGTTDLRIVNTLAANRIPASTVRLVGSTGRIEHDELIDGQGPVVRTLAEALRAPWWAFGHARDTYTANQDTVRDWVERINDVEDAAA